MYLSAAALVCSRRSASCMRATVPCFVGPFWTLAIPDSSAQHRRAVEAQANLPSVSLALDVYFVLYFPAPHKTEKQGNGSLPRDTDWVEKEKRYRKGAVTPSSRFRTFFAASYEKTLCLRLRFSEASLISPLHPAPANHRVQRACLK